MEGLIGSGEKQVRGTAGVSLAVPSRGLVPGLALPARSCISSWGTVRRYSSSSPACRSLHIHSLSEVARQLLRPCGFDALGNLGCQFLRFGDLFRGHC